jgi:hypothetical protein
VEEKGKNFVYRAFSRWLVVVVPCAMALGDFPMKSGKFWQFLSFWQPFVVFSGAVQSFMARFQYVCGV